MNVISFETGNQLFTTFINYPAKLFPGKLSTEDYPVEGIDKCFMVVAADKVLGRIAVYKSTGINWQGGAALALGNFHCINDQKVADLLFNAAVSYASSAGAEYLIGPMNGTTWHQYRFSEPSEQPLFFTETWNPEYYSELWRRSGFFPVAHYSSSIDHHPEKEFARADEQYENFKNAGVKFRNIYLDNYEKECKMIYTVCIAAFADNYFYSIIDFDTFFEKYKKALPFIDPSLVVIAEDRNDKMVGFAFGLPDILNPGQNRCILKTLARDKRTDLKGLGNTLGYLFRKRSHLKGFSSIIHAFYISEGPGSKLNEAYQGEILRNYTLFGIKC